MSLQNIKPAFPTFQDIDGQPLENGFVYVGTAGLDAVSNGITIYWDSALTTPATQPVRTKGGYAMNGNSPGLLYTGADDFSLQVSDKNNSSVNSALNQGSRVSSNVISYTATGTGAVSRTLPSKLGDFVSVKDYGATGDGVTDDTAAIQAALDASRSIYLPVGNYKVNGLVVTTGHNVMGENMLLTTLHVNDVNGSAFETTAALQYLRISNLSCTSDGVTGCRFWKSNRSAYVGFAKFENINTYSDLLMSYDGAFIFTEWESCVDGNNGSPVTDHQGIVATSESVGTPSNMCTVKSCHFFGFTKAAIDLNWGYSWSIQSCDFELGTNTAIQAFGIFGLSITTCWFENNAAGVSVAIANSVSPSVQGSRGIRIESCYCNLIGLTNRFCTTAGASSFSAVSNLFAGVPSGVVFTGGLGDPGLVQFVDNQQISGAATTFFDGFTNKITVSKISTSEMTTSVINSPQTSNQNVLPIGPTGLLAASFTNGGFTSLTDVSSQVGLAVNAVAFTASGGGQFANYTMPTLLLNLLKGKTVTLVLTGFTDTTAGADNLVAAYWDSVTPGIGNYVPGTGAINTANDQLQVSYVTATVGASATSFDIGVFLGDSAAGAVVNIESMQLFMGEIKPTVLGF